MMVLIGLLAEVYQQQKLMQQVVELKQQHYLLVVNIPPGAPTNATEEYNGTTWTGGGSLATARRLLAGAGTQTAGLAFGGELYQEFKQHSTEEYNGTSWTARRKFTFCKKW
jgi:hypothetical protein